MISSILLFNIWHIQPTQTEQFSRNVSHTADTSELISQPEASSYNLSVGASDVMSEMHSDICVQIMGLMSAERTQSFLTKQRNRTA